MGLGQDLLRSKGAESLVRVDGVVDAVPGTELTIEDGEFERVGDDFLELLGRDTLSAVDMAVEFGGTGVSPIILNEHRALL